MKGFFAKVFGGFEAKSDVRMAVTPDQLAALISGFGGGESSSGEHVTHETAMRCAAVFSCVGVLSESVAQLPLKLYREIKGGGKEVVKDHPLHRLLNRQPNEWMTAFEWREMGEAWLCLTGNHYAFVNRDSRGRVSEILPLPSDRVTVEQNSDWTLKYTVSFGNGRGQEVVPAANMLHIRYRTKNGFQGISPIGYARESIGLALATEKHGARLFKNGARPGGVLEHPGRMSEEAAVRFKAQWQAAFSGENSHKTALLEDGMKFSPNTMTSEDAQYLETRRFQTADIARIFRVPLHMIQETEKSTSFGTGIESITIGFVRFTLLPWLVRWEQALMRDLLTREEQGLYSIEHMVEGMERGDIKSRYAAYNIGIMSGILSPNEVRAKENLNPRDGGDEFLTPMNMRVEGDTTGDAATTVQEATI